LVRAGSRFYRGRRPTLAVCRERSKDEGVSPVLQYSIMPIQTRLANLLRGAILVLALCLFSSGASHAQGAGPFARLSGSWAGKGTIDLANGTREALKCRASYDVQAGQNNLQLNIRCASDSYNFELTSSAALASGAVTGTWSESPHGAFGTISGTASGERIQVKAEAGSLTATLSLVTHANSQTVVIRAGDQSAGIKGATINLRRGS
jgi:hypothetical protein